MKKLLMLLTLTGSLSYANTQSNEVETYKEQACVLYSQLKSDLKPFLKVKQNEYVKNSDGTFTVIDHIVPNETLEIAMIKMQLFCVYNEKPSLAHLIRVLNETRNNIWDANIQARLQQIINQGFAVWSRTP